MMLSIYSLNVRGLNDPAKVLRLRNYLQSLQPAPDIFLIQEHKLTGSRAANLGRQLHQNASYFFTEALQGYGHLGNESGAGCGGTAMLVNNRLERNIANIGSLHQGRVL